MIIAVEPQQIGTAGRWGKPLAHIAYRVGEGPHLFRANTPVAPREGLMVVDDGGWRGEGDGETLCNDVLRECAARHFSGVVCRFQGKAVPGLEDVVARLGETCGRRGLSLYVSEPYAQSGGGAKVLIPSALSGGTLRGRLEDAGNRFGFGRVALWVDRSAEDFLLPAPSGAGTPLTMAELNRRREEQGAGVFFSSELCAHYFSYMVGGQGHFVLFDDAGSIREKLRLAGEMGVGTVFLAHDTTGELLGELLG